MSLGQALPEAPSSSRGLPSGAMQTQGARDNRTESPWGRVPEPLVFKLFNEDALEFYAMEVLFLLDRGQNPSEPPQP